MNPNMVKRKSNPEVLPPKRRCHASLEIGIVDLGDMFVYITWKD
jgi:hypothetical protein